MEVYILLLHSVIHDCYNWYMGPGSQPPEGTDIEGVFVTQYLAECKEKELKETRLQEDGEEGTWDELYGDSERYEIVKKEVQESGVV